MYEVMQSIVIMHHLNGRFLCPPGGVASPKLQLITGALLNPTKHTFAATRSFYLFEDSSADLSFGCYDDIRVDPFHFMQDIGLIYCLLLAPSTLLYVYTSLL